MLVYLVVELLNIMTATATTATAIIRVYAFCITNCIIGKLTSRLDLRPILSEVKGVSVPLPPIL